MAAAGRADRARRADRRAAGDCARATPPRPAHAAERSRQRRDRRAACRSGELATPTRRRRMKIAILAPVLSARDAVGTDVLDMATALRGAGHEVRVCAEHADGLAETV